MTPDPDTLFKLNRVHNYYGSLHVCLIGGVPHAGIEDYDSEFQWTPVSTAFYDAVRNETP